MKTTLPLAVLFALVMGSGLWFAPLLNFGISLHILLGFHIAAICLTGALVLYADEQGLAWMLGKKDRLNQNVVHFMHYAVAVGLAAIIVTGAFLLLPRAALYLGNPDFIVKMIAVAVLIINTYFIDRFSEVATRQAFRDVSHTERMPLFISGVVSVLGWATALIGGLLLHH
jgi:branched-subunit amino acid transport protein